MITPILINNYQLNNHSYKGCAINNPCSPVFTGKIPLSNRNALFEKNFRNLEFAGRKILNKILGLVNKKQTEIMFNELSKVDEKSPDYIETLTMAGRFFAKDKEVEINLEQIADIASSNESCIFIMNHDNQKHDPEMLAFFSTLLNSEYIKLGKALNCPRSKIILNEDILLSMDEKMRTIFEKLGAIGIDASLFSSGGTQNAKKLISIMKDFIGDKVHIYIFPEGKMAGFKNKDLKEKFQTGVAEMVYKFVQKKEQVKVIPLGFAYNKKSKPLLSSINVGEPVLFKKDNDKILVTKGNMDSTFTDKNYINFFKRQADQTFATITEQGNPVIGRDLPNYIGGILCENLRICREEAKNLLPKTSLGNEVINL